MFNILRKHFISKATGVGKSNKCLTSWGLGTGAYSPESTV